MRPLRKLLRRTGKKRINRSLAGNMTFLFFLSVIGAFMALPLVYAVANAFKPLEEILMFPPKFYVMNPTFNNFLDLFDVATSQWVPFSRYLFNSVFVSVVATGAYLVIAAMCAYVLSRHDFYGKAALNSVIIVSLLFTSTVMGIPQYIIMSRIGFIDTPMAIIFPILGSTLGVFLLKQIMDTYPETVIESAKIEGASEMQLCWRIVMPGVKPGWITLIIFTVQNVRKSTAGNMIFTENIKVLPTMLMQIVATGIARAGVGAAASMFIMIPPIAVFVVSQSRIIETMSHSGIKE